MGETIRVDLPLRDLGEEFRAALEQRGLRAEVVEGEETPSLEVRYAGDERERLTSDVAHAIEGFIGERLMPLVVERSDRGCVVRPPGD